MIGDIHGGHPDGPAGSVLSVASGDSSRPGIIGYAPRAAGCGAVDHPGQGITQPKAYEEGQQRVVGSLLSDCFRALPVVPLHLRVMAHRFPNITAPLGVGLLSGLRDGAPHVTELLLGLVEEALGRALLAKV